MFSLIKSYVGMGLLVMLLAFGLCACSVAGASEEKSPHSSDVHQEASDRPVSENAQKTETEEKAASEKGAKEASQNSSEAAAQKPRIDADKATLLKMGDTTSIYAFSEHDKATPEGEIIDQSKVDIKITGCKIYDSLPSSLDKTSIDYDSDRDAFNKQWRSWTIDKKGKVSKGYCFLLVDAEYKNNNKWACEVPLDVVLANIKSEDYDTFGSSDDMIYVEGNKASDTQFYFRTLAGGESASIKLGIIADKSLLSQGNANLVVQYISGTELQEVKAYSLGPLA